LLFLKNAWVDEDAYITFRSVEQLFAGNGPRWNPHERVQAFTHPLWLALLSFSRLLTRDLFACSLAISWLCSLLALLGAARLLRDWGRWAVLLVLLFSSKSFFDFTASGLETPLAYALLCGYLLVFWRGETSDVRNDGGRTWLIQNLLLAALLLTRHDLLVLVGPAHLYAGWRERGLGARAWLTRSMLGLLPFILWTAFSLLYYGFPLPNTAYAKLGTGIPAGQLVAQGFHYLRALVVVDGLTAFVLALAVGLAALRGGRADRAIAAGLALDVVYVVAVGGDYMVGRFFACAYFVAALMLVRSETQRPELLRGALLAASALAVLLPGSPITSGPAYHVSSPDAHGVGDQRGLLFETSSLHRWRATPAGTPFPDYRWTYEGLSFRATPHAVRSRANIGFMGYAAGTEPILVDRLGLADPLLARLPSIQLWRIGHFPRRLPEGYLETIRSGEPAIVDPGIRGFHEHLSLITEADLLAAGRLTTILKMNLGLYDDLLEADD
jgi:arabinofuranosyltransferase